MTAGETFLMFPQYRRGRQNRHELGRAAMVKSRAERQLDLVVVGDSKRGA